MLARRKFGFHVTPTSGVVLSADRRTASYTWTGSSSFQGASIRRAVAWTGKRYFEFVANGANARGYHFGFIKQNEWLGGSTGYPQNIYGESFYGICNGNTGGMVVGRMLNGTGVAGAAYDFAVTDVVGVAVNFDTGDAWMLKNNAAMSGDPAAGTSPPLSWGIGGDWDPFFTVYSPAGTGDAGATIRCTGADCTYSPPAGFGHLDS